MITFPRPFGGTVSVPVQGVRWSGGNLSLTIVDSGYKGRSRYAVVADGERVVGYAPSMEAARVIARRAAGLS